MIIRLVPETQAEKEAYAAKGITEIEHNGVKEYMIFGNKVDNDGDLADFHEWHGSFRYLMGTLDYFYQMVNDKRRSESHDGAKTNLGKAHPMVKRGSIPSVIQPLDLSKIHLMDEEGAFDEDEARAMEIDNVDIAAEDLEPPVEENKDEETAIQPKGLRILK